MFGVDVSFQAVLVGVLFAAKVALQFITVDYGVITFVVCMFE